MSAFTDAIAPWIDQDGLIGSVINPTKWTGGNELLETATACVIELSLNGKNSDTKFLWNRQCAILACRNPDGSFDKNPGRPDRITHDDLYGVSCVSKVCIMPFAQGIYDYGSTHKWMLSNISYPYWDAYCKPWDVALYKINANQDSSWYELLFLCLAVLFDAAFGDSSTSRLFWLVSLSTVKFSPFLDLCFFIWKAVMTKRYGTVGGLMLKYYGDKPISPIVEFGNSLKF